MISDINYECTPYSYAPLTAVKSSFPTIWETATILPSDTTAQGIFATINGTLNSKLPNDLPKGMPLFPSAPKDLPLH